MTELMTGKIISQLKIEANYDLEAEKNKFDKKLKQADIDYKYLNDFYNDKPTKISIQKRFWISWSFMITISLLCKKI